MAITLKNISDQTIVITGASSGIGLTTARLASEQGAKVVLVARNGDALAKIADELRARGGQVRWVEADVADQRQVRDIADYTVSQFGGFDTWVNNAGVTIFGRLEDGTEQDHRRLFDTNFWGVVNGSLIAAEHLKQRGGALINVGSETSDRAVPLQGMYSASKHAVKGFTDALRMELEEQNAPVSVSLIKPAAIDTMFVVHAKNYMAVEPKLPPPVYAPEIVADAIIFAAQNPKRDLLVGGGAKLVSSAAHYAPRLTDKLMTRFLFKQQQSDQPSDPETRQDSLHQPSTDALEREGMPGHVFKASFYTKAAMHPTIGTLALAGSSLALVALWQSRRHRSRAVPV